jgi:protocatechuate 3,4-dioxygenase beta subunit
VRTGQEPAGLAWIELGHTPNGSELEQVSLLRADARGELVRALEPGALRVVAWSERTTALPAFAQLEAGASTALEIALEPAFPVAGRVIDGRTGAPVAGAEIAFWTFAELDSVRSEADGTFRHPRFPPGAPAQQVRAAAPGYGPAVRYLRIDPAGGWKLAGAAPDEPSLAGTGTPWLELVLVPELVIRGRVLDELGQPLAAATLGAEGYFHVRPAVAARDAATAVSDETGSFELSGLRSDIGHALTVEAAGHARRTLELGPVLDEPLVITLAPAALLSGTVIDGAGTPAEDIELVLLPAGPASPVPRQGPLDAGARVQSLELRTRTDATGTFLFEGLAPGPLRLVVQRDGDPLLEHELEPLADGRFAHPLLVLPPDSVTLEGSVRDERGRLLAGARVELERQGRVAVLTTDAAGRFRCAGLDLENPYRIRVTLGGLEANASAWASERPEIALDDAGPELARARTH